MILLDKKIEVFRRALGSLERSVDRHKESSRYGGERFEDYRDSLVVRFKYCMDLLWKVLKVYLEEKHGVVAKSPKSVFKECFSVGVLTESETEFFLRMVDDRNLTSHMYKEEFASRLYINIPEYYYSIKSLLNSLV